MVCKFSETSVTIKVDNDGMFAHVHCHHHEIRLPLSKPQIEAYNSWVRGEPNAPIAERHGSPPSWWYHGLIEQARKANLD